jgi:hypothetical protein
VLASLTIKLEPTGAVLTVTRGDAVIDEERWQFERRIGQAEADEFAKAIFDCAYDTLQFLTHGDASTG